jgi:CRP-like cAMP-binding protein
MEPVTLAFLFGGLSALSLPLGAAMGLWLNPGLRLTAAVMAFGAGALLCALALGLVVPALGHFPDQPIEAFKWLALGAMLGCLAFIGLDHLLAGMGGYLRKSATLVSRLKRQKKGHFHDILAKLSVVDLMVSLPPEEIRRVLSDIERRVFKAGELICHEEDPCDALFLIESGKVSVLPHAAQGLAEAKLLGKGEAFGELALVTGLPPIARAEALKDTVVWEIHKDDFNEVVAVSPGLQAKLKNFSELRQGNLPAVGIDKRKAKVWLAAAKQNLESEVGHPTEADMVRAAHSESRGGSNVALAIWLGIALDGIPESLVIGASMEGTTVSLALIGGLFMANFPESMSSAAVMKKQGGNSFAIIGMWLSLMIMTAVGAAMGNLFIAETPPHIHGMLQGLAAGAMLAMIAQTMLPEAYAHGGWLTGLMTVSGFLAAIGMGLI